MSNARVDPGLESLLEHIKEQRGFDFTGYKRASLERRIRRRMAVVGLTDFDEYQDHLLVHPDEFTALFNTILINVTSFFRDPDAWDFLREKVIPELLAVREGQPIRAWSAGCASGQEAFTLGMVFAEALGVEEYRERVKIYATDVDEEALAQARQATFSAQELESVPAGLREKYFESAAGRFAFRKELRRSVIFGRNDLIQDAPISNVDILACRNTLMYFNAETQAQILGRLHFGLKPDGILFLGKAEMLLGHSGSFRPVDLKRRFFRKVPTGRRDRRALTTLAASDGPELSKGEQTRLQRAAFMSSAAAQIVLDSQGRLTLANHRANHLFGLGARDLGRPIQDLEVSYRPTELRGHLDQAAAERRPVWLRDVEWVRGTETTSFDVQFLPMSDENGADLGATIIFNDVTQYRQLQRDLQYANRQLATAYEELQSTNEELETTNEELQSTVEELETTNEELQSTNEELETMNEELQSMNDELQYSNEALQDQQDQVDRMNKFMTAVLGSLSSGVVVVDRDLRVLAWNARAEDLWGVRSEEAIGEPLLSLDIGLPLDSLRQPIRTRLGDHDAEPESQVLRAVNRRGRPIDVRVTIAMIRDAGTSSPAVMLAMDVVGEA
ncbi:CheR family methyltransferase [Nocardioides panaciterrulae]|uniref:protein-glutamate O-methyltransferase n=1 Tax=Nocardioides panaciterrulae TaxID=661492 RepID=A0A7Y9E530_9ACTN|nr:protein-glutamate O-methyltransferase CheR [Nocardioides panaciterrulae]NYD40996.1 two-component system CheB/CheR fusion protein [Nocardioides panaciterrulae]